MYETASVLIDGWASLLVRQNWLAGIERDESLYVHRMSTHLRFSTHTSETHIHLQRLLHKWLLEWQEEQQQQRLTQQQDFTKQKLAWVEPSILHLPDLDCVPVPTSWAPPPGYPISFSISSYLEISPFPSAYPIGFFLVQPSEVQLEFTVSQLVVWVIASVLFLWCWNFGLNLLEKQILFASWVWPNIGSWQKDSFVFQGNHLYNASQKSLVEQRLIEKLCPLKEKFVGLMNVRVFQIWVGFASGWLRARLAGETAF